MTRREYLDELNTHLMSLSSEERENAVRFYEEYFEDAGAENEQQVIEELGKPYALAKSIICEQSAYSKSLSYAQYRASRQMNNTQSPAYDVEIDNTPDIMPSGQEDVMPHTQYTGIKAEEPVQEGSYEEYKEKYTASGSYTSQNYSNNSSNAVSIVLAIIFGIPGLLLLILLFSCFVMASGGCFIGAVIIAVVGLINLAKSFGNAMAAIGTATVLAGMGFLFSVPGVLGFGKAVPGLIKLIVKAFKNSGGEQ